MNREKTALLLADCLAHMPQQPDEVKVVIAGLKRIAQGGEWPEDEARATADATADAAADAADAAYWAAWAAADAAKWAAWAAADAARAARTADWADWAADWAARAHPNPDKERARQAKVRKEMKLNTKWTEGKTDA